MKLPIFGNLRKNITNMGRNTSISLGDYFESFVDNSVAEGRYKNASEVIRAGLRLLELEENKIIALKMALKEGLESGINKDFNPSDHIKILKGTN
ncbi:type II toxin-antitoxin system ParD family antitoxin [Aquirufa sp. ROCK-SH2]